MNNFIENVKPFFMVFAPAIILMLMAFFVISIVGFNIYDSTQDNLECGILCESKDYVYSHCERENNSCVCLDDEYHKIYLKLDEQRTRFMDSYVYYLLGLIIFVMIIYFDIDYNGWKK